ncbi:MAG TPA: hypothetical protein VFY10_00550 [Dehalococcoidia bacterium]|nr:hypothetical protein [Dehalococcoidia bacterium]
MSRWLALLIAVALWPAISQASAVPIPIPGVVISGGDLPHAVHLAPVDADAFRRRVNRPPHLQDAPAPSGPSYTVSSPYWQISFLPDKDKDESDKSKVAMDATYYPDGGYVLEQADGHDAWIVIDLRQRAILDRYIRITQDGGIGENPDALQVLASFSKDEPLGVQIGSRALDANQASSFWAIASTLKPLDLPPNPDFAPPDEPRPVILWITITTPAGQAIQFLNSTVTGTLVEPLSQTVYPVAKDWLAPILGPYDATTIGTTLTGTIEQHHSTGSHLWWIVMVGGGLLTIGLAALWQRRLGGRV